MGGEGRRRWEAFGILEVLIEKSQFMHSAVNKEYKAVMQGL